MGTVCGSGGEIPEANVKASNIQRNGPYDWKKIELQDEVYVPNMHPHKLKKFRWKHEKEEDMGDKPDKDNNYTVRDEDGNKVEYYDEVPDWYWLCNGAEESTGFEDGCKSGCKDFEFHEGIEGWQSMGEDEDFDLCEMCIRWAIHCDRTGTELGLLTPKEESEGDENQDNEG